MPIQVRDHTVYIRRGVFAFAVRGRKDKYAKNVRAIKDCFGYVIEHRIDRIAYNNLRRDVLRIAARAGSQC